MVYQRIPHLSNDCCRLLSVKLCQTISTVQDDQRNNKRTEGSLYHADFSCRRVQPP